MEHDEPNPNPAETGESAIIKPAAGGQPVSQTFEVANLRQFEREIAWMNRRASKLGVPPITYEVGKSAMCPMRVYYSQGAAHRPDEVRMVEVFPVTVTTEPIKLPGDWEFVARLEHEPGGNLISAVPGMKVPEVFRQTPCECEHCKTNRVRKHTFVVRSQKSGEHVQVGTNCMSDFLGHESPDLVAQRLSFQSAIFPSLSQSQDAQRLGYGEVGASQYLPLDVAVAQSNAVIRQHGYMSSTRAREIAANEGRAVDSTRSILWQMFFSADARSLRVQHPITEEDQKKAQEVIKWVREDLALRPNLTDYQHNLAVAYGSDTFRESALGVVVSGPAAYAKEKELLQKRAQRPVSNFVGKVGERVDFDLTLDRVIPLESELFGVTWMCLFSDKAGNVMKWKSSNPPPVEEGQAVLLKGTIQKHDHYQSPRGGGLGPVRQTVISRCKVIDAVKKPPSPYVDATEDVLNPVSVEAMRASAPKSQSEELAQRPF